VVRPEQGRRGGGSAAAIPPSYVRPLYLLGAREARGCLRLSRTRWTSSPATNLDGDARHERERLLPVGYVLMAPMDLATVLAPLSAQPRTAAVAVAIRDGPQSETRHPIAARCHAD
jgi:hypothetical protein